MRMVSNNTILEQFIEIESNSNLWNYEINGIHLWPLIRTDTFTYVNNESKVIVRLMQIPIKLIF